MLQTGIKTRLTLRQANISPLSYSQSQCKRRNFTGIYSYIRYRISECSIHEMSFALTLCGSRPFLTRVLNPLVGIIYIVTHRQTVSLYHYQVTLTARSSSGFSSRLPLSSIAPGRSSRLSPVSVQIRCKLVFAGWLTLARLCVIVYKRR